MSRYDQESAWSNFRVGVIAFLALSFLVLGVILAGGDKGLFFRKTSIVKARLADIGGLKKGSSVTMGGMAVGRVTGMGFAEGSRGNQLEVAMEIRSDVRTRIKTDSIPTIRTQGMMGDRYIDISVGTGEAKPLAGDGILIGDSATDFDRTLQRATDVLNETDRLLTAVNEKRGTVGQFFYDQELYNTLTHLTRELDDLIQDFKKHPRKYIKFSLF